MTAERTNIAPARDRFVGRSRELEQLESHLHRYRLVTILGEGGAGKTRLARQFGAATEAFDEVWFCDLLHAREPDDLVATVAETLGIEIAKSASAAEFGEALAERGATLLILDNLEQIAEAAARVVDTWLKAAPNVTILATSREPLRIRGEIRVQLEPLETEAALELFGSRARELQPNFELDADNRETVERIVERLDGLPLAIELAASRVNLYAVDELLERLETSIQVLRSDSRTVEQRHRTMRDAIAWSWELLDEIERRALAEMSVFVGGFSLEAAREILIPESERPVAAVVESLVEKSLVRRVSVDRQSRFELLAPVGEFAADQLDGELRESVELRHARYFADVTLETRVPRIGRDIDNVVAGFWNVIDRDPELGAEAGLASYMLLRNRGSYPKIRQIVERALADRVSDDAIAAKLHGVLARCMLHDGEYETAFDAIDLGVERASSADDARSLVFLNSLRSRLGKAVGKPSRAGENLREALEHAEDLDDPWLESTIRGRLAGVAFDRGDFEAAERKIADVTVFCRTHELDDVLAHSLTTAARHQMLGGDLERAESLLEQAAEAHPGGEEWFALKHRTERGFLAAARGDEEAARRHFDKALEGGEVIGNRRRRIPTLYGLSLLEDDGKGASPLLDILEIVEGTDDVFHRVQARTRLAVERLRRAQYPSAESLLDEAHERAGDLEHPRIQPHVACWLALAMAGAGDIDRADALLDGAAERLEAVEDGEALAAEVDDFFRPIAGICGGDEVPERSTVVDLERRLRDATDRRADAPHAHIWLWRGWDHRDQLAAVFEGVLTDLEKANPEALLRVAPDGRRFAPPDGDVVDLRSREAPTRILRRLAQLRDEEPGDGLEVGELVEVGWPDEVLTDEAGKARVYTAVRNLRSAGLEGILETGPEGYHLDPNVPFDWLEESS